TPLKTMPSQLTAVLCTMGCEQRRCHVNRRSALAVARSHGSSSAVCIDARLVHEPCPIGGGCPRDVIAPARSRLQWASKRATAGARGRVPCGYFGRPIVTR